MSKYWIFALTVCFCFIFGSIAMLTFTVRNRLDYEKYPVRYENLYDKIEYSYIPKHNNLNIILLHLKNPGLENKDKYNFSILNSDGNTIVSQIFSGGNVGDPSDLKLQFYPINNSDGQNLTIRLEKLSSENVPILVGVDENGVMTFSSFYRSVNKCEEFRYIFGSYINHMGKDPVFFTFLLSILLLIIWKWK
jgi:hypothetical protein